MFHNRRKPLSSAPHVHPTSGGRLQRHFHAPLTALVATALVGTTLLSGCGCDDSTDSPTPQESSTVTSTTNRQYGDGAAPATTPNASDDTLSSPSSSTSITPRTAPNSSQTAGPTTPPKDTPTTPIVTYPAPIQPGSVLPQTNLDSKYAPLGVPIMSPPGPIKPFIIVVSLTREQTLQLHEKQVGEKIAQAGSAVPLLGDPVAAMGGVLAGSSTFSADHPNTCVRTWVELGPNGRGTYATYVTGTECPATMKVSGQLPGPAI